MTSITSTPVPSAEPLRPNPVDAALSRAINGLCSLDPAAELGLRRLEGQRVRLTLTKPAYRFDLCVRGGRVELSLSGHSRENAQPSPDLEIRTSPSALLKLIVQGEAGVGQLRIEGDAELARWLSELVKDFRPDVDELFSRGFGDVLGFQLARAARVGAGWLRESVRRGFEQSVAYVRDETRDVVSGSELSVWLDEVDALRDRVERVEYRLLRMMGEA